MSELWRDEGLDRLVRELNRDQTAVPEAPLSPAGGLAAPGQAWVADGEPLERLLAVMVGRQASDLLLVAGERPVLRVDGRLERSDRAPIPAEDLRAMFATHLGDAAWRQLADVGAVDLSLRLAGSGVDPSLAAYRFRVNLHRQRGELAAAIRALPRTVPTLERLRLPASLAELVAPTRGLVLVCGPTGSGKSSTLAALLDEINRRRACHVITIEDPIEYEHSNRLAVFEQLEVGRDTPSFAAALRAAMRQDPDVLMVGEMRDLETVAAALTAAETGHLVLSTLHTNDVAQAVHRIVDIFPPGQQAQIRQQLALALSAILCQQLVPRLGGGRVVALELLLATYPVRHHIRSEQLQKLYGEVATGRRVGMISLEESLSRLVRAGEISPEEARLRSARPEELASLLAG
jgi:twitching motility protein PilT